jgi:hypothetical protein
MKTARHEEGNSLIRGSPHFSFIYSKLFLTSYGPGVVKSSRSWQEVLCARRKAFLCFQKLASFQLFILYLKNFRPKTKHFYQVLFCRDRVTTGLYQLKVKKGQDRNDSVSGQCRMRLAAGLDWLELSLSTHSTALNQSQVLWQPWFTYLYWAPESMRYTSSRDKVLFVSGTGLTKLIKN